MKTLLVVCAALLLLLASEMGAIPVGDHREVTEEVALHVLGGNDGELLEPNKNKILLRWEARMTCDVVTPGTSWAAVSHYCATRCTKLPEGYKGGFCDHSGVCICTK